MRHLVIRGISNSCSIKRKMEKIIISLEIMNVFESVFCICIQLMCDSTDK